MSPRPLRSLALAALLLPCRLWAAPGKVQTVPVLGSEPGSPLPAAAPQTALPGGSSSLALPPALPAAAVPSAAVPASATAVPAAPAPGPAPVERRSLLRGAVQALRSTVRALTSAAKPAAEAAARREAPAAELSAKASELFEGRRAFLKAAALGAAAVCVGACGPGPNDLDDYYDPPPDGDWGWYLDIRRRDPQAVAAVLNQELTAADAYPAHVGYNTWDEEYHVGAPRYNDFYVPGVDYQARLGGFDELRAQLSALTVEQAVGSKLVYVGNGRWALFADTHPSDYWTTPWLSIPYLYSAEEVQDELNFGLYSGQAMEAKVTGAPYDGVRLTYPLDSLDWNDPLYWELESFDTFFEAMAWAESSLSDFQNRGAKIYYSRLDLAYHLLYPLDTASHASRLGVSEEEMRAAVEKNSRSESGEGRDLKTRVDWRGVYRDLGR